MEQDDRNGRSSRLIDAEQFLRVSEALKGSFARLEKAALPDSARQRWKRRLIALTELAKEDLDRAERECDRCQADFQRMVGGSRR